VSAPTAPPEHDPSTCTACRGSGELISGLGGTPHRVRCPWCDGTGRFDATRDAQAPAREGHPADESQ
jgi:DnaJ-class molecular chaperone